MAAFPLKYKKKVELPIAFDFDTGWIPDGSALQVRFYAKLPAYTQVEMQGGVFATWPDAITLDPFGLRGTGKVEFDYGLMIGAQAKFQVEVLGKDYGWEGDIPFVPKVDFHVDGYRAFDPWAWEPGVIATGYTPKLTLFTVDITDALIPIPGIGGGILLDVQGELGVRYTTDRIVIVPTNGTVTNQIDKDITGPDQQALHAWQQGAWGEYLVHPEGRVEYGGAIHLIPTFYIEILTKKFKIPVYDFEYEVKIAEQKWVFEDQLVHVPLPDVRAPELERVSAGEITLGEFQVIEVPFSNIGEAVARLDAEVDHPAFKLMDTFAEIKPGNEKKIRVRYTPTKLGVAQGKLRVTSNDPDQPEFVFDLEGSAVAPPPDPDPPATSTPGKPPPKNDGSAGTSGGSSLGDLARNGEASQDGGCGCRAAPASSSGWAIAPLLLAFLSLRRSSSSRFRPATRRQETSSP
jgi:MYXO-CTERM domain-containing protein